MQGLAAYRQTQNLTRTRIEIILTLYRRALTNLSRARQALAENKPDAARPFLLHTQTIVMALSAELPAYKDEFAINCLRLYEFVAYQMAQGGASNIDAAERVLRPLLEGFEAVREEATALEMQGKIVPLDRDNGVSLTA